MSDQEFQLAVIAIVFGSVISIILLVVLGSVIRSWIKKPSKRNLADNEEFLEALRQFKKKTDRRLSNLEAIVIDDDSPSKERKSIQPPGNQKDIEVEKKKVNKRPGENLRNMLNE